MPRPLTRAQRLENAAFLKALRKTGNAREAALQIGQHRAKFTKRRAVHPQFAADWTAALAVAHAALHAAKRCTPPSIITPKTTDRAASEPRILLTASGRLQLRRTPAGRLNREAEQAFLAALSATANVRLSAAAAGFSHSAFYARKRQSTAFAREMRLALEMGYERLEMALLESSMPDSHDDDAWRHNDPPAIPPMTANQALQLLYLHQKEARLRAEPAHIKRRRGESKDACQFRMAAMWEADRQREREDYEAARRAGRVATALEPPASVLPDLGQVTGWSRARGEAPHHAGVALFGGWRLGDVGGGRTRE